MSRRSILLIALFAAASLGFYLLASQHTYRIGFPLDDAWIHQTYARNLADRVEWSFLPGQPSAGSTAPAWSLALAAGRWLALNPIGWAFLLGWGLLACFGLAGAYSMRELTPNGRRWGIWAGLFLVFEWHLVWAAGSGMETLAYSMIVLLVLVLLIFFERREKEGLETHRKTWQWFGLGALVGFSVWVRPDGISLLAVFGFAVLFSGRGEKLHKIFPFFAGFLVIFLPYLMFNYLLAGSWWPNTFFAKQAEYAALREVAFWRRYLVQARLPLVGVGILLLPGFIWTMVRSISHRKFGILGGGLWMIGYLGLYAWRLPVVYQHGRYVIPAMAVYFVWGLAGLIDIVGLTRFSPRPKLLANAWTLATGVTLILFWLLGAKAYAQDVAIIESEMVRIAQWVNRNTPVEATIAAHDIGALGYYGGRPIVDLAGLVSPEVIQIIRDEPSLKNYLDDQQVDYLVTFPAWYPFLTSQSTLVYSTNESFSRSSGGENMAVYRWIDR